MNRKQILTIAFIVDSLCWIALGFFIGFSTNAIGGTMSIETTTTLNPAPIEVGSAVIYVCPWNGFDISGVIVGENSEWGEGFFDIQPDNDEFVDTAIHLTDIRLDGLFT